MWAQTYPEVELIVVDDGSTDGSAPLIQSLLKGRPEVKFLGNSKSVGNCKAFNLGYRISQGKYLIDLAADDVLMPDRVAEGVRILEEAGEEFGVHFSDAIYIDGEGRELRQHYKRDRNGELAVKVPQGWIYADVIQRYFICTPSMMVRRIVLDELEGYDESLAYEDFDFWVRSARHWQYCFSDQVLVKKRVVPGSWSTRQYERESRQLESTLQVCRKAKKLNKTKVEDKALGGRLAFETRKAIRSGNFDIASKMLELKKCTYPSMWEDAFYYGLIWLSRLKGSDKFPHLPLPM